MNMNESKGMVIPKSYKNVTEKKFGMSYIWLAVASLIAVISAFMALLIMFSGGLLRLFFIACLIALWAFFWKKLRNDDLLEHAKLSYLYFLRLSRGDTAISKYNDANIPILKQFLPVEAIHPNGLIQYTGNLYFLLLKYTPVRLSDDMRDAFLANTVKILNSLQDGVTFKFFVVSRNRQDDRYEKQILMAANRPDTAVATKEHLFSLQKMVSSNNEANIQWDFFMSFGIGKYDSPQAAEISRQTLLTGLHDLLETVESDINVLESPYEITYALYNCITQEV
jgi:hypothetical protein